MGCHDRESNCNSYVYRIEEEKWYVGWGHVITFEAPERHIINDRMRVMNIREDDYSFKILDNGSWKASPK